MTVCLVTGHPIVPDWQYLLYSLNLGQAALVVKSASNLAPLKYNEPIMTVTDDKIDQRHEISNNVEF